MKKELSIRTIVAIGIGSALFVILGRFAAIPTGIPNTNIDTSYALLALMAVVFGPVAGGLIGLIGHALKDAISYGSIWWSWVIVSSFVGLFIGFATTKIRANISQFQKRQIISFNISQAIVQFIGWGLIAPVLDIVIYAEPANKVFTQGIVVGISNSLTVGILGTILIAAYSKAKQQDNSLQKEA